MLNEESGVMEQEQAAPATLEEAFGEENAELPEAADRDQETLLENETQQAAPTQPTDEANEIPNSVWAAARKRAEAEAARKYDQKIAARFGQYKNPATGQPVQSLEEYLAALDAQEELVRQRQLQETARALPEPQARQLLELVKNDPERKRLEQQLEAFQRQQLLQEGERQFSEQLREISTLDPEIKSLADISAQPEFEQFDRLVRSGSDMVSAYKAAFFERLAEKKAKAGRQAAINAAKGKSHLIPVGGDAGAQDDITDELVTEYRKFLPHMTREQIRKYHNRYKKGD